MLLSAFWASSSALTFLRSTRPTNDAVLVNSSDDTDTAKMQESAMGALGELEKKEGCECIVGPYKGKLECECCLLHESCSSHDGCVWEGHLNFHKRSLGTPCYSKYYPTVSDQEASLFVLQAYEWELHGQLRRPYWMLLASGVAHHDEHCGKQLSQSPRRAVAES
eukprot:GEMP01068271.1.p1 GENE.GEMP01068271.1~~GEMP01068271.1.p1  ORF type:complete len:194 (+),score=26.45 GEMP01068271.1:89-583(+)